MIVPYVPWWDLQKLDPLGKSERAQEISVAFMTGASSIHRGYHRRGHCSFTMACGAMDGWIMWYLTWRHAIRAGAILSGAAAAACLCLLCRLRLVRSMVRLIIRQVVSSSSLSFVRLLLFVT